MNIKDSLIEAIRSADRADANRLSDEWAAKNGHERLLAEVMEPAIIRINEEWCPSKNFSFAQVYLAAKVAEDVLTKIAPLRIPGDKPQPYKGPVVIGNIEDDFHALGH